MLARASAVFSGVLLIAMIGLQCFIVVGAVGAVRHVRRVVLPIGEGVSGELPAFRWETGREASHDRQGSRLYRWDAYGRPQVRRAWPSTAPHEAWGRFPCDDELWVRSGMVGSRVEDEPRHPDAAIVKRYRSAIGPAGTLALVVYAREPWQDVSRVLAWIRASGPQDETWVLRVWTRGRELGDWRMQRVDDEVEGAPEIRLQGSRTGGRTLVQLQVGSQSWAFPPEPTAEDMRRPRPDTFEGVPLRAFGPEREENRSRHEGPSPFESARFVDAANQFWPAIEHGIREAVAGHRAVVLRVDETEQAPVRWGYVVAVLDLLTAADTEVVRFEPGGHTLRFEVPDEPDVILEWKPPPTPSVTLDLLAGSAGVGFALLVVGLATRRGRAPSRTPGSRRG